MPPTDTEAHCGATMTAPHDRRPSGAPARAHFVQLAAAVAVAALFIRGQLYIGATLAGTRPGGRSVMRVAAGEDAWAPCAEILAAGLRDVGEAAGVWQRYAHVGLGAVGRYRCRCQLPEVHPGPQPKMTAIVQSFNHAANVRNISGALKESAAVDEIVVCEDGSTDGSLGEWQNALPDPGHFIIRSNNLHELRSYNRAMRMSSGDIVVLLQDDDLLPMMDTWLQNAHKLFAALPELGVLGGYIGQLWDHDSNQGFEFGEQVSTHGGLRKGNTKPLPFIEPTTGLPFMYAECVWIAPVFVRRSLLRKAGGLELSIAKRGEPGVWQDCVFSYEAWVNGFSVGSYDASFERGVGGHGSATSTAKVKQRELVWKRAVAYANRKYSRKRIHEAIVAMNNRTLNPRMV